MPDQSAGSSSPGSAPSTASRRTMLRGAGLLGVGVGFGLPALLSACGAAADDAKEAARAAR